MYSKANYRDKNDIIIPENYSGNAFAGRIVATQTPEVAVADEVPAPVSNEYEEKPKEPPMPAPKPVSNSFLSSLLPPKVSNPSGILSNIGLEEMLIVGVLILLSQSDTDDDILLLLFLLLFYK